MIYIYIYIYYTYMHTHTHTGFARCAAEACAQRCALRLHLLRLKNNNTSVCND